MTLENYTNQELLKELNSRLIEPPMVQQPEDTLDIFQPLSEITPYSIIMRMIEQGWKENPKIGESDPRIDKMWAYLGFPQYSDDESYCAATVNACLKLAGYETSGSIPVARSFESYGKQVTLSHVKEGDIVVFERNGSSWRGHVGFVTSIATDSLLVSGGNQENKMCTEKYSFHGSNLRVTNFRRISEMNRVTKPDIDTLKAWGLY